MASQPKHLLTAQQYLELEKNAAYKSEFFYGEMFAMSGGSINHASIGGNLYHTLRRLLRDSKCKPYNSDARIVVDPQAHYAYPDISIVCGEMQQAGEAGDSIANPVVIFEVLSPSTERHDRGAKFRSYQSIQSLREYFLVSQDNALVERFERTDDGRWTISYHEGMNASVQIASAPCELALNDVYEDIVFAADQ
ncbi:MAG: Uma2 family endonuclease [Acidobacteria bacterium]|nr:Uma2 family endonuclease [Acidobacteriota bacterium]